MLAAYNAGPGRYDHFLTRGRPLPAETVGYLAQLAPIVGTAGPAEVAVSAPPDPFAWRRAALFVRTASAASDAVGVQTGSTLDTTASPPEEVAADEETAAPPLPVREADTLFVPRARPGRPQ